jgi:hypothetical protein
MAGVFQRFVPQIKSPKVVVAIYLFLPFDFSSLMCAGWGVAAGGDLLHHGTVLGGRDAQDRAKKTRVCSTMTPKSGDNLHNLTVSAPTLASSNSVHLVSLHVDVKVSFVNVLAQIQLFMCIFAHKKKENTSSCSDYS